MKLPATLFAAAAALSLATPAVAQDSAYDFGNYWNVTSIHVEDGQFENYMDHLAGQWRASLEFARSNGWVDHYHVVVNSYPRESEADLVLITVFEDIPNAAEQAERQQAFQEHMSRTTRQLDTEFGARQTMRTIGNQSLYQELILRAPE